MQYVVRPGLFNQTPEVTAFFTGKEPGTDVSGLLPSPVFFPVQEHTSRVVVLQGADDQPEAADAVLAGPGSRALGIKAADCVPVLIYDPAKGAIGAVHAGWRGTAAGILKITVQTAVERFGSDPAHMLVAIGPAIRWCCYRVGRDVLDAVVRATGPGNYHKDEDGEEKSCLDLQSANRLQALSAGVREQNIEVVEECTCCYADKYHSYRRDGAAAGRQGAFIAAFQTTRKEG